MEECGVGIKSIQVIKVGGQLCAGTFFWFEVWITNSNGLALFGSTIDTIV